MTTPRPQTSPALLLAAASAGLLAQSASAANHDDTASDLSNNTASPTSLTFPAITGVVNGSMNGSDTSDALQVLNLLAGSTFFVDANWFPKTPAPSGNITFAFRNSQGDGLIPAVGDIVGLPVEPGSDSRSMTVPADGIVEILGSYGGESGGWNYNLFFEGTQAPVPEPATTAAAAAAALAALMELRRRQHGK
jgi:hypothetical protein